VPSFDNSQKDALPPLSLAEEEVLLFSHFARPPNPPGPSVINFHTPENFFPLIARPTSFFFLQGPLLAIPDSTPFPRGGRQNSNPHS